MDRAIHKQEQVDRRREEIAQLYPSLWKRLIAAWNSPDGASQDNCSAGLMYSANYLLRCGEIRLAIDPIRLKHRLLSGPEIDVVDLKPLSLVLLTHRHSDHLDINLLRRLKDEPILWIIPEAIQPLVLANTGIPKERVLTPCHLEPVEFRNLRILPFDSWHWEEPSGPDGVGGIPETGYLMEYRGQRWLFPGDIRTYDAGLLPHFGPLDVLFAHLWLGRACALRNPPPLVEAFCRFCLDLQPRRIVVTHLEEFGRDVEDYWDRGHYELIRQRLGVLAPDLPVEAAYLGEFIRL